MRATHQAIPQDQTDSRRAYFEAAWARMWTGLGARGDGRDVLVEILALYAEPRRKYHTLQHLHEVLTMLDLAPSGICQRLREVQAGLWFHDAIYELRGSQNEFESAQLAVERLGAAGVPQEALQRISGLILATRHTAVPQGHDACVLVDIDLSILGAPRERFEEYERQIRAEYSFVPGPLFRMKRREILKGFLARPSIYSTEHFRSKFERSARENLRTALGLAEGLN